jgi:hypothetical protein
MDVLDNIGTGLRLKKKFEALPIESECLVTKEDKGSPVT